MDFGVLDGLISSQNNNKNTLFSCCDLDSKPKWYGSGGVFSKHENPVSVSVSVSVSATHEDEWRDMKMAKINDAHNMLSFSSPNTNTVTLPYYARNTSGYGIGGPFTQSQWMELEHQALIYKYITANADIPTNLLIPIKKALETAALSAYSGTNFKQNTFGWGGFHLGFCNSSDPEPGRCRRTDGKKWRCAKDAVADQKYCERHMNRGRHRSRKPVEGQTGQSVTTRPAGTGAKMPAVTAASGGLNHGSLQHGASSPALSSQENRSVLNKANLKEPLVRTEFGLVCSDSLLNPLHKSDHKSQTSLRQFMEDWPNFDQAQLSISNRTGPTFSSGFVSSTSPPTIERLNLSPLRMGLGMGNITYEQHASQIPISWETSMGGPLGEVLQHSTNNSPSALNLMTDGWDNSPQMTLPSNGVLQKTAFGRLL